MRRLLALLLASSACGSSSAPPAERAVSSSESTLSQTTIEFSGDWSVTRSGDLVPGRPATLRYDLARLGKCRATKYGLQAWAVAAYVSFDGAPPRELLLAPQNPNVNQSGVVEFQIPIPVAADLSLWFHGSDDSDCSEWDSKYGQNFHFAIQKPNAPVIRFGSGWTTSVDGIVHAGEDVIVDYDLSRAECRSTYNGNDAFGVTMWFSIDGGAAQSADMTRTVLTKKMASPARITLPHGSNSVAIWFENNDTYGCHSWDSAYGANYVWHY